MSHPVPGHSYEEDEELSHYWEKQKSPKHKALEKKLSVKHSGTHSRFERVGGTYNVKTGKMVGKRLRGKQMKVNIRDFRDRQARSMAEYVKRTHGPYKTSD